MLMGFVVSLQAPYEILTSWLRSVTQNHIMNLAPRGASIGLPTLTPAQCSYPCGIPWYFRGCHPRATIPIPPALQEGVICT